VADQAFRRGPAAGHRAPDGPLRLIGNGRSISLFSHLRGTPHHLLLFAGSTADGWNASGTDLHDLLTEYEGLLEPYLIVTRNHDPEVGTIPVYVDESGLLHERYGLKGAGYYLVRPDGYVAFRAPGTDLRPVWTYLQRKFVSPALIKTRHR
jgi:hypothetical protein